MLSIHFFFSNLGNTTCIGKKLANHLAKQSILWTSTEFLDVFRIFHLEVFQF